MTEEHTNPEEIEQEGVPEAPEASPRDFEAEARDMGWKPKDEWKGDPEGWRDAEEFVRKGEEFLPYVRAERDRLRAERERQDKAFAERVKRLESANKRALEHQKALYEAEMKAIEDGQKRAKEEGDFDAYEALAKRREGLGPAPEVPKDDAQETPEVLQSWAAENTWFHTDDVMRAVAIQVAGRVAQTGGDVQAQIRAAEEEVKRRFPEKFETRKPVQAVETGGQPSRSKQPKGVANLPKEARDAFEEFKRMGVYKQEDLPKYAKAYWEQE